ncbi:hypothetical protein [Chitinophaga sp. XS-30]|uniref:hypothetical protein n=1 Tax=Chitinophaga sp. XS-30 TaxID=2604421 RepID=UPI0011DD4AF6|nr:hypothetical protein [Chitinophaga sp. XS-30]QEH40381.1 hypothetical protein FW415_05660 [Chitinophaga sp. XS-30]
MKRIWKIILMSLAILIVLILGTAWYLSVHWKGILDKQLSRSVKESSDSLYTLAYREISLNLLTGSMGIENVVLLPDSAVYARMVAEQRAPSTVYNATMSHLQISGMNVLRYFLGKKVDVKAIVVKDPEITIIDDLRSVDTTPRQSLYASIHENINSFSVGRIDLADTKLTFTQIRKDSSRAITQLEGVGMNIRGVEIDSISEHDPARFLYAREFELTLDKWDYRTPDSLYWLHVNKISYNAVAREMNIGEIKLEPRYSKADFDKQIKTQQDRFQLAFRELRFQGIPFISLLQRQEFFVKAIDINGGELHAYRNRKLPMPPGNKLGQFPNQLLHKMEMPLHIDSINVKGVDISYTEVSAETGETGKVMFHNAGGIFRNISNVDSAVAKDNHCKADLHAILMQTGKLRAHFDFTLGDTNGAFAVSGQLNNMDGKELNGMTTAMGNIQIRSAHIRELEFSMKGNERSASGTLKFLYSNLKIGMLKDEEDKQGNKRRKGLASLFANLLAIKNENPSPGEAVRVVKPVFRRDIRKSFFNLVWKTIFTGVKETVGTPLLESMGKRKK